MEQNFLSLLERPTNGSCNSEIANQSGASYVRLNPE